jgi:hypothetical protein
MRYPSRAVPRTERALDAMIVTRSLYACHPGPVKAHKSRFEPAELDALRIIVFHHIHKQGRNSVQSRLGLRVLYALS